VAAAIAIVTAGQSPRCRQTVRPNRLRRGIFLLLKFALVQPVMLCGFVTMIWIGPVAGTALLLAQLAYYALSFLTLRWVLLDQRNRCPVCLRPLTEPVRIGAPSQTFLEWYGSESACPCGHGLLQTSEMLSSYSAAPEWHRLDASWSGPLFAGRGSEAAMTLELRNVSKQFPGALAVDDVSFPAPAGETTGYLVSLS
jgi:hypothetical protein